jgi:uncharacterized protein (UPF0371 family)
MFELTYQSWDVNGTKVAEMKRITLDAGRNIDRFESHYKIEGAKPLMHAASALVLNAVKKLAGIPHQIPLLSSSTIESVAALKNNVFGAKTVSLDLAEVLICLSINAATNPTPSWPWIG